MTEKITRLNSYSCLKPPIVFRTQKIIKELDKLKMKTGKYIWVMVQEALTDYIKKEKAKK